MAKPAAPTNGMARRFLVNILRASLDELPPHICRALQIFTSCTEINTSKLLE
jgi:hypothetical protein